MELIKQYMKGKRVKEMGKKGESHIGLIGPTQPNQPNLPPASGPLARTWPAWPNRRGQPAGPASRGPAWPAADAFANPRAAPWPPDATDAPSRRRHKESRARAFRHRLDIRTIARAIRAACPGRHINGDDAEPAAKP